MDFGIAKALHRSMDGSTLTGIGVTIGTPAYMAPEQAVGDPAIDHRADAMAAMYASLGDSTRALELLDEAAEDRAFTLVFLANYPMFNSLHKSARYRRLVDRIGVVPPPA